MSENQNIIIENRNKTNVTGVIDVISFDDETVLLNTNEGKITVKGENLKIESFNNENGDLVCGGKINAIVYMSDVKSGGFFSKLTR